MSRATSVSLHTATVEWQVPAGEFRRGRFSRDHRWRFDGGLELDASASTQVVPAPYANPAALDPEEAFVAALASCHMMSFLYLANRAGLVVARYRDDAEGELVSASDGHRHIATVTLRPRIEFTGDAPDDATLSALHEQAHATCYIANSVRSEIVLAPR